MALLVNTTVKQNNLGVTNMNIEGYKLFAQLCESITEASTSLSLITGQPGGQQVIRKLHTDMALAHNQEYRPVDKISWSELKDSYRGAWVIIQGSNGVGAIKASGGNTGSYNALASDGGEVKSMSDSRGGNVVDFLKSEIGKLQKFYVGKNTTAVTDLRKKRASDKVGAGPQKATPDSLVTKFRPLWTRALTLSIADIKGMIANQIKNDAFDKAKKKINQVETLQNALEALESGSEETPDSIKRAVNIAVIMAAAHYYPDETGDIQRSYSSNYTTTRNEGPQKLLQDITQGDTKKLGTVLGFFKRSLISG